MEKSVTSSLVEPPTLELPEDVKVISQIMKLTQEGKIKWRAIPIKSEDSLPESNSPVLNHYEAKYNDNTLRLLRQRIKRYVKDELGSLSLIESRYVIQREKGTKEDYYWEDFLSLRLIDPNALIIWAPQYVSILEGLETSVRRQVTGPAYQSFVSELFAEG